MENKKNLSSLTFKDLADAKTNSAAETVALPAGKYPAKILAFVEEETYNYVSIEINKKRYNLFYNYTLKDSDALDANVMNWIIALAQIPVTDQTSLLEITNSAIGSTYEIEIRNYVARSGKNAGKEQNSIAFWTKPVLAQVTVEEEDLYNLPI